MGFEFNPAHIQTIGIGFAAFLSTVLLIFVFLSARHEPFGRLMIFPLIASTAWAWFGFLYHLVPYLWLARELRIASVVGIVWIGVSIVHFAVAYLDERVSVGAFTEALRRFTLGFGAGLTGLLFTDLFGTKFVVGDLTASPNVVLAPEAAPAMALVVGFYAVCIGISGVLLALRARAAVDRADRRSALLLFVSMTVGLVLGGTRFTPWYGFDFYPLVGDIGYPLFAFSILYAVQRYNLLNVQVAVAQALVFALWTFTFFRMLLNPTLSQAVPDIFLFLIVLVLGVFLIRSVVAEIRTQKELAKLTVERMKSEFVTIAAHQLRTPLAALRWAFSLLLTGDAEPLTKAQRDIAEKGARAADNMMALSDDLLNVARISNSTLRFDIEPGDVRDAVRVATALLDEPARRKRIRLTSHVPEATPTVRYDRGKLAYVLENLIDNAIKYTEVGGSVDVTVAVGQQGVSIAVSDTGVGIPPQERSQLFGKFFRGVRAARMSPDGSGLGLYIAKMIVEGHGGTIDLVSEVGRGTTVTIMLPAPAPDKK